MEIEALIEALLPKNEDIVILKAQNAPADVIRANEEMNFHLDEYRPLLPPHCHATITEHPESCADEDYLDLSDEMKDPRTWSAIQIVTRQKVS
jgi:hypothetical protein